MTSAGDLYRDGVKDIKHVRGQQNADPHVRHLAQGFLKVLSALESKDSSLRELRHVTPEEYDEEGEYRGSKLPGLLEGVEIFMLKAGQLTGPDHEPQYDKDPYNEFVNFRHTLFEDERQEYDKAFFDDKDATEKLDAIIDMIYILWGTALAEYGPKAAHAAADEVTRSNLDKVIGEGLPIFREDGKVMKPEGWIPPDIQGVLERTGFY